MVVVAAMLIATKLLWHIVALTSYGQAESVFVRVRFGDLPGDAYSVRWIKFV